MAKPIPKSSILDGFEPLGLVAGARRWRSHGGKRLYTWDSLHGALDPNVPVLVVSGYMGNMVSKHFSKGVCDYLAKPFRIDDFVTKVRNGVEFSLAQVLFTDFEHRQLAGRAAPGVRVDHDQRVVPVQQVVREVHAADAVVGHPDPGRQAAGRGQSADHLRAESVVAEKEIAELAELVCGPEMVSVPFPDFVSV